MLLDEAYHHVVRNLACIVESPFHEAPVLGEVAEMVDPLELLRVKIGEVEVLVLRPQPITFTQHHDHFVIFNHFSNVY